ncbi:MAG: hypothetical protein LBK00_00940 [Treponema sp.]|nr:hypothetical protein [Treponema sp.]
MAADVKASGDCAGGFLLSVRRYEAGKTASGWSAGKSSPLAFGYTSTRADTPTRRYALR